MSAQTNVRRARLELAIVALGTLLLGLTPYPRAFTAAMRQAESHRAAREYGAALSTYQEAIRLDPEHPLPWLWMGQVLLTQHRFLQATVAFREVERSGSGVPALLGLGESYAGRGDWAAALETWARAQALAPKDARVYLALGRGAIAQSQFEAAEGYLARALQLEPTIAEAAVAHALLGRLFLGSDLARAAEHLKQAGDEDMLAVLEAARAEPDASRRAVLLGAAFLQRSDLSLARRQFELAVSLTPADTKAWAYLAHTLDLSGETFAAGKLLERAVELDPESVLARYFLGVHQRQAGNIQGAQATLWQAILRDPENAALRVEMGQTFLDLGDYAHAEEWYKGAVEVAPQGAEFHLVLVHFYLDHLYRVAEKGVPAAEAALALTPDDSRALDLLGWAYHLAGRSLESSQVLEQTLDLDPDLVSAHYHLGSLWAALGQNDRARLHLQRAADLDTDGYYRTRAELILQDLN